MKLVVILVCSLLLSSPVLADIYKWRDSNGSVHYSDVAPPSNIKQEAMYGHKVPQLNGFEAAPALKGEVNSEANQDKSAANKAKSAPDKPAIDKTTIDKVASEKKVDSKKTDKAQPSKEEAATKSKEDELKSQAELKIKQENCKSAKSHLAIYNLGGKIANINEKGEKYYLKDADISQAKADAQSKVDEYCQ